MTMKNYNTFIFENYGEKIPELFNLVHDNDVTGVKEYIKSGKKLDVKHPVPGWDKQTPLIYLNKYNTKIQIIRDLINAGADINYQDDNGYTPLSQASYYGKVKNVRLLIDAGAILDTQDSRGFNALFLSAINNNIREMRLLIDAGADWCLEDKTHKTFIDWMREDNKYLLKEYPEQYEIYMRNKNLKKYKI